MERDELAAWLRLTAEPGLGRDAARRLLAALGSPEAAASAPSATVARIAGTAAAKALEAGPADFEARLERTERWLHEAGVEPRHVIALGDPDYPQMLLQAADPPLLLYVQGRLDLLDRPSVAIVGSRQPSAQGLDTARRLAEQLSRGGHTVVSGLALGIDGAAHLGALDGEARTIAVVGTGLDRVYPKRNLALAHRIAREGAMLSEFPLGMPALPNNFPRRNRIIAGMTRGTLVIEAALKSGSLITARLASEAGREVFAVPGSIHSRQSQGCHALIKQGAKLVERVEDVLDELGGGLVPLRAAAYDAAPPQPDDDPVLAALGEDPVSLDALIARTGWPAARLNARLLELELDGAVARLPGQLFQRRHAA